MTNHTAALSFARDTTVYAHAPAKEDVDNLKAAYLELRELAEALADSIGHERVKATIALRAELEKHDE